MKKIICLLALLSASFAYSAINHSVSFDLSKLSVDTVTLKGTTYSQVSYEQMSSFGSIDCPVLPRLKLRFSVPYNASDFSLSYHVGARNVVNLPYPILKGFDDVSGQFDKKTSLASHEPDSDIAMIESVDCAGTVYKIVTVSLTPFVLDHNDTTGIMYSSVSFDLTWTTTANIDTKVRSVKPRLLAKLTDEVSRLVKNPEDLERNMRIQISPLTTDQEDYDYVIIAPSRLCQSLERLAAFRRVKGYGAKVFSLEYALTHLSEDAYVDIDDDAGKLRAFIGDCYYLYGTRHVLLAGKYPEMPVRYGDSDLKRIVDEVDYAVPSDLYFSDLDRSWGSTTEGIYGVKGSIDYYGEVNIGRLDVMSEQEINDYIDKLMIYELNPGQGDLSYLDRVFMSRQDYQAGINSTYNDKSISGFRNAFLPENIVDYSERKIGERMVYGKTIVEAINNTPCGIHNFIGHGNPGGVAVGTFGSRYSGIVAQDQYESWHIEESGNGLDNLTNKDYPGWCFSMGCMTIPFDYIHSDNTPYPAKYIFGDSYVLGKGYGGVAYIGNSRVGYSYDGNKALNYTFTRLSNVLKNDEDWQEITSGAIVHKLRSRAGLINHHAKLSYNLIGDPLTQLWMQAPYKMGYQTYEEDDNGIHYGFGWNQLDSLWIGDQFIEDQTYAHAHKAKDIEMVNFRAKANHLYTLYGKETLPTILPLYLQNISFMTSCNRYIIADKVFCGSKVVNHIDSGNVVIMHGAEVTIESMSDVELSEGVVVKENGTLNIIAKGTVLLDGIVIEANAKLYVKADYIEKSALTFEPTSEIVFESSNYPTKSKVIDKSVDEYKPLVVEGRTWWYGDTHAYANSSKDYGMRIGKTVEMDGKQWNEVRVIKTIEHDQGWTTFFNPKDENILVALIREEDKKVYSRVLFKFDYDNVDDIRPEDYEEAIPYDFSNVDDEFTFCRTPHVVKFKISEIDKIENSGNEYTRWTASYQKLSDTDSFADVCQAFQYVEQIGVTGPFILTEIFYYPFYLPASDGNIPPFLRYVTEGEDNTIIYEAAGGHKLWQVTESVDNVSVDNDTNAPVEYYDVYGRHIDRPTPGSVVIRRQGSTATKIVVK